MGRKVRSRRGDNRRIWSMYQGSDGSDYDYEIGDDEEFDDSDCSSLDGEESEGNTGELEDMTEEEEKLRVTGRLKRRNDFPRKNKGPVGKPSKLRRVSYKEDSDEDYEEEDEEEDDDDDYDTDDMNLLKRFPIRKRNGVRNAPKKKAASCTEEKDDDYGAEDDEAQNRVWKAPKMRKASSTEENDDDYKTKDDEYDEDDEDYDGEEVEEDEDDEDFSPDEIEVDDEDEFIVGKKTKKARCLSLQEKQFCRGRKRGSSMVSSESKRKKSTKRRGFQRKLSSTHRIAATKGKSTVKKTTERNLGFKRRRLVLDSDSDFVDSGSLNQCSKSEEEMEQFRDASELSHHLNAGSRKSSLKKRSPEEEILRQERKHNARKGKGKVENSKKEVAKQVCGICFSEEGKKTVRGTLNCCSHYFCFSCIMEWSKVESRCPLCKQRFVTISKPARLDAAIDLRTTIVHVPERDQVYQPSEEELRAYLDPYENVICTECHRGGDDAYMLLCDLCDSPAHTFCVGLDYAVPEGNWYCEGCRPTALGSCNPLATDSTRDWRATIGLSGRSSPSENIRVAIDLNRVYEPETPLTEETGTSSPRHVDGDLRAASSVTGSGVQTVRERRRRRHQIAQFVSRTGGIPTGTSGDHRVAQRIEWGSRFAFQNVMRPETTALRTTFSQGGLQDNFTSSLHNTHLLPATLSNPRSQRIWGQTFAAVNGAADGTLQASLAGVTGGIVRSVHGQSSMQ